MAFADLLAGADRAALTHLGEPVTYATGSGETATVRGVFDAAYQRADAGQAGIVASAPAVFLRLADLPSDPAEDDPTVTVGSTTYTVREVQQDGQGGVVLHLRASS